MIPASLDPLSYLLRSSVRKIEKQRTPVCTYVEAKKVAIIVRISVSVFDVSSNPGVSMRITLLPSRVNSSASVTSAVHDANPIPIRRFEPLARLINWRQLGESPVVISGYTLLTEVFPLPVAPITL